VDGQGDPFQVVNTIEARLRTVTDGSRCYLPHQVRTLVQSLLALDDGDLAERLRGETGDPSLVLPKLTDIVGGVAHIDITYRNKQSDWTYSSTPVRIGVKR
jgi:hypothetical protein